MMVHLSHVVYEKSDAKLGSEAADKNGIHENDAD